MMAGGETGSETTQMGKQYDGTVSGVWHSAAYSPCGNIYNVK